MRTSVPGVATGLAVTGAGGDVLFVEATACAGGTGLELTGQLGDVMKESARIALSYVRGHTTELGIDPAAFDDKGFHIHVPAGAIPKDGPSAGVTMVTALASLLSGRKVKHTVGMTGEVTLQGRVLPIGGLKQKVLAAHAAGLTDVILPERNRADLDDVPAGRPREHELPPRHDDRRGAGDRARAGRRPPAERRLSDQTGRELPSAPARWRSEFLSEWGSSRGAGGGGCGKDRAASGAEAWPEATLSTARRVGRSHTRRQPAAAERHSERSS